MIFQQTVYLGNEKPKSISNLKFGDIACGCGGFFITIVNIIKQNANKSYFEIFKDNIFGLDIQSYSIERTKILLTLLAISDGEDCIEFDFNIFQGMMLPPFSDHIFYRSPEGAA